MRILLSKLQHNTRTKTFSGMKLEKKWKEKRMTSKARTDEVLVRRNEERREVGKQHSEL